MATKQETPTGFILHAQEFFSAADLVLSRNQGVSLPAYFLLGRSIELSLKAFLLKKGIPIKVLRKKKYGHDLHALLNEAMSRGLKNIVSLEPQEIGVIDLLSFDYMEKRFEYRITGGQYALPLIDVTHNVTRKLAWELEGIINDPTEKNRT